MALYDDVTLNIATGHFYLAPVGTAKPAKTALAPPAVAWTEIGHTSIDNIFTPSSDGGDVTTLGTLQSKTLRQSTSNRTEKWAINLEQFDVESLKLYFGSNAALDGSTGWLDVPNAPTSTQKAFLAVFVDGANMFGIYSAKCDIKRGDDWNLADTTSLVGLPLSITPLSYNGATSNFSITPLVHTP